MHSCPVRKELEVRRSSVFPLWGFSPSVLTALPLHPHSQTMAFIPSPLEGPGFAAVCQNPCSVTGASLALTMMAEVKGKVPRSHWFWHSPICKNKNLRQERHFEDKSYFTNIQEDKIFLDIFYFLCMSVLLRHMLRAHHTQALCRRKVRSGYRIPWNWSYGWLWVDM